MEFNDIIMRVPRNSSNRKHLERLRKDEFFMAHLNEVADRFNLTVVDVCRLLLESEIFNSKNELLFDKLIKYADQIFRQRPEDFYLDVPSHLAGRCDIHQYNWQMRNELSNQFIRRFFPGAVPEWIIRILEILDVNYRLKSEVINVLIHYIFGLNNAQRVTKTYIDAVASNMLIQNINSFEKAIDYVRDQLKQKNAAEEKIVRTSIRKKQTRFGVKKNVSAEISRSEKNAEEEEKFLTSVKAVLFEMLVVECIEYEFIYTFETVCQECLEEVKKRLSINWKLENIEFSLVDIAERIIKKMRQKPISSKQKLFFEGLVGSVFPDDPIKVPRDYLVFSFAIRKLKIKYRNKVLDEHKYSFTPTVPPHEKMATEKQIKAIQRIWKSKFGEEYEFTSPPSHKEIAHLFDKANQLQGPISE